MILGVPINGAAILFAAVAASVLSRIVKANGTLDRILGTLTAPCAEVCRVCCDEVRYDGSCTCDDDGGLAPLPAPPSVRHKR